MGKDPLQMLGWTGSVIQSLHSGWAVVVEGSLAGLRDIAVRDKDCSLHTHTRCIQCAHHSRVLAMHRLWTRCTLAQVAYCATAPRAAWRAYASSQCSSLASHRVSALACTLTWAVQ